MQETVTDVKYAETVFSCRKCREKLYGAGCLIDEHGTGITSISQHNSSCTGLDLGDAANTVWFINERSLPDWMEQLVNEANWIKGKLMCPKCRSRVGSFDYVSGSKCPCGQVVLPPVHVVKAKVDLKDPLSVPFLRRPSGTEACATSSVEFEKHETEDSKEFPSEKKLPVVFEESSSSQFNKTFSKTPTENEKGLDTLVVGTSQIKIKKCHKTREKRTEKLTSECKENTINDAPKEPLEDVICPVCLDIYTNPFICYPCVHVFCEICLRHIAKRDPQKTLCPLCRQQIGMCLPDHDRYHRVRTLYPTAHKSRQKTLQNLRDFPLPWQPHYRLRQLSNVGRSFLCNERGFIAGETYATSSMWNTISTVALLVFLQIVAMLAFFVGYHGGKYVLGIVDLFFVFAEYAVQVVFGHYWPPSISDMIGCTRYNFNDTVLCI